LCVKGDRHSRDTRAGLSGVRGFSPAFTRRRFYGVSKAAMNRRTPRANRAVPETPQYPRKWPKKPLDNLIICGIL
jgi:hypothetical protein